MLFRSTWGGLVGYGDSPDLMDGGIMTIASFGIFSTDGKWIIENEGVSPDIEVKQIPKDVLAGHDPQLERGIQEILNELKDYDVPEPKIKPFPNRIENPDAR